MQKKLAIITTHPIQYNAPFFRLLAQEKDICLKVFYTWGEGAIKKHDPGFNRIIEWDLPLLEGYEHVFVRNAAKKPGSHHFWGIDNPTLITELESWQPAAILVYGWAFRSHLALIRHFYGRIPVFFRGDSTLIDHRHPLQAWLRRCFLRWVYKNVDLAFYPGLQSRDYFLAHGLRPDQLAWMPHAIDNERFGSEAVICEAERQQKRTSLGIKQEDLIFLYAGKLEAKKNVALLIDVFRKANLSNAHLLIVGNGSLEQELKKRSAGHTNISFQPFQNQSAMPGFLVLADVSVLPSKQNETWGLILNEAMACGKPVLASEACGAAADLVVEGINGYCFRNNDQDDLVNKMRILAQNREALKQMGVNARERIKAWSFQKNVEVVKEQMSRISKHRENIVQHEAEPDLF